MLGKRSSGKSAKNFFYIHTNIVTKKWGKKRAKQFFRNTRIVHSKMLEKTSGKNAKKVFYIHTNIVPKKGGKTRVTIFLETNE